MRSRLVLIALMTSVAGLADGYTQLAAAQCPAGAKIYIDPRLVPRRPQMTKEQFQSIMSTPPSILPEAERQRARDTYFNQNQPVQMPFRNGSVLISPHDPCIQQFIGP